MIPYTEMSPKELIEHYRTHRARLRIVQDRLEVLRELDMDMDTALDDGLEHFDAVIERITEWNNLLGEQKQLHAWLLEIADLYVPKD